MQRRQREDADYQHHQRELQRARREEALERVQRQEVQALLQKQALEQRHQAELREHAALRQREQEAQQWQPAAADDHDRLLTAELTKGPFDDFDGDTLFGEYGLLGE